MTIIWKSSMSVGSQIIDNEHKYLFSLVNCVLLAVKIGDSEEIKIFIDQLIDYANEHFSHEEKLQIEISYPGYYENKEQHQKILANLHFLKDKLLKTNQLAHEEVSENSPVEEELQADGSTHISLKEPEINAPSEKLVEEISHLLRHWILEHVLTIDRKMSRYVSNLPFHKR